MSRQPLASAYGDKMTRAGESTQEVAMKIRDIGLIVTLVLGLLVTPLLAEVQQAGKVYRIGFFGPGPAFWLLDPFSGISTRAECARLR